MLKAFLYKKEIRAECAEAITLSDGTSERNFPNFEKAVETMTDPEADYVVTFNVPAYVSKFALPKKAKSVTLEGEALTVSVSKIAANCSLTINNTIIPDNKNGTLDISMAKNGTLTIGTEMSLNSVSGAAGSVLAVNEALTVNKLSGFASVVTAEGTELTVTGTAKFTEFDGTIRLEGAKTSANITTADGEIILAEENGVLPKATVSAVENELKVIVDNESGYIANSTVILYAGKGDITAKVKVENTDPDGRELKAFLYKKAIKAECAEAITLSDGTNERDFPNIEKAIESMTDPAAHYVVTLNSDAYCTKFAMPKNAASVTFTSNGDIKTLHIGKASSISAKCGLVFENIRVESDKKFKITANAGLTISGLYSDTLTAVSGSKKSALVWDQSFGGYDVSGFGRVIVNSDAVMGTGAKFNVSTLEIQDGGMFVVNSGSKSTIKDIIGNGGKMYFAEGFSSVTISNTASGIIGIAGAVKDGDMLFTAKKADLSVFDVTEITPEGDIEYGLINIKGKVYFRGRLLEMNGTRYTLWSEMISVIEKTNDKKADYTICVLDSTDIGEALKMPKKDTYASIAVISEGEENSSLKFTGGITLTGNTVFENVNLSSVKKGVDVKYTISAGKYDLAVRNCGLGLVSAINGTGNVELENVNITGTAKAGVLKLTGRNVITGGVTANAMTFGENAELVYFKGSKVSVSKNGIIGENTITLHLIDKLTNKYAAISAGDVIVSTLKGDYSGQFILSEGNGSYGLKLAKAKLIAE